MKPTSAQTMRALADRTTKEGLDFVKARKILEDLWKNGEEYHSGMVDYAYYCSRNRQLWDRAELEGLASEVKRQLRTR